MWEFFKTNPSFFGILFSALLGGTIAIVGIWKQRQTAVSKNTIDFEVMLGSDEEYDKHWEVVKRVVANRNHVSVAHWADNPNFDEPEAESIRYVLNSWERAANGINKKVYDSHFLYEMYGTHVISMHDHLLPYVMKVREVRQPKAHVKFLDMAEQWRKWRNQEDNAKARRAHLRVWGIPCKKD
ncbi:DUF4760 domain-containing protein [Halomonas sp. WWR20]